MRRYNYTTPKSYLELISLYKGLLAQKRAELHGEKQRLESGVDKISQASAQARALLHACMCTHVHMHVPRSCGLLGQRLTRRPGARAAGGGPAGHAAARAVVVEEKKAATQTLIESIGREKAVVDEAVEASRSDEEAAARLQARRRARGRMRC